METEFVEAAPTFEVFRKDLLQINSDGDLQQGHVLLLEAIDFHRKTISGDEVTWSYILKKFTDHVAWWNYHYKKQQDGGFISGKNQEKRKNIEEFIEKELYNREWNIQKGSESRNAYLFGKLPTDNLLKQLENFKNGLKEK